jgi:hypothetical protein
VSDLDDRLADMPLYLAWERQGKVHWTEDWVRQHGPIRQRIPGLEDHISFANFDLKQNDLPQIQTTENGRPFVMCIEPMTEAELSDLQHAVVAHFSRPGQAHDCIKEVGARLAAVARLLDVVAYHGFAPAMRTQGLDHLDSVLPRQETRIVDYQELDAPRDGR